MSVTGLKEDNLQHRNEIRHAAFVSDAEQCKKPKELDVVYSVFVGPQFLCWI